MTAICNDSIQVKVLKNEIPRLVRKINHKTNGKANYTITINNLEDGTVRVVKNKR